MKGQKEEEKGVEVNASKHRNQDQFIAGNTYNYLFATNNIKFLHLGVLFMQIYCVSDKLLYLHCRFSSKYIFIYSSYSRHLTVPTEPEEVYTHENIISIDAKCKRIFRSFCFILISFVEKN